ncbi:MAG: hypothetical protein JW724_05860 [Candidatus Altiarchaeota archaeon]|nr:hypothetical protein [Candidatus Altiarchaeota archaeon]
MKKHNILAAFAALTLIFGAAWASAGYSNITDEEYLKAYLAIYQDYLLSGEKFSREELLDVVDCYLNEEDLEGCKSRTGARSGKSVGEILERAGAEEGGYSGCVYTIDADYSGVDGRVNIAAGYGIPSGFTRSAAGCYLKMLSGGSVLFLGNFDPSSDVLKVPCYQEATRIQAYCENRLVLDMNLLKDFCDRDGVCDMGESVTNCPVDCGIVSTAGESGKESAPSYPWFFAAGMALVLAAVYLVYAKGRK